MEVKVGEMCPHGTTCGFGAWGRCRGVHTEKEYEHFRQKEKVRALQAGIKCEEARSPCSWCVRGCCKFGTECRRGLMVDSEYESAEDDALEEEATVKGETASRTVKTSAGRQVSAGWKRLEGARGAGQEAGV